MASTVDDVGVVGDTTEIVDGESTSTGKLKETEVKESTPTCHYCTVEASVVTGFEECARGEAREKFNTDEVKAARGKITWKVPIDRVTEVIKMGSIDNARVVLHSVPHFGFTADQHDSLSRLQKMLPEADWEVGLRVWEKFSDFPHKVASRPDVVPSLDDLVDVCIAKPRPPRESDSKKGKKGGRGKKKERRNEKKGGDVKKKSSAEKVEGETGGVSSTVKEEEVVDGQGGMVRANHYGEGDANLASAVHPEENGSLVSKEASSPKTASSQGAKESAFKGPSPKTVIIKRADRTKEEPKIDIKVLIPGPNENAFPSHMEEGESRDLEPMEVDRSILSDSLLATPKQDSEKEDSSAGSQKQDSKKEGITSGYHTQESEKEVSSSSSQKDSEKEDSSAGSEKQESERNGNVESGVDGIQNGCNEAKKAIDAVIPGGSNVASSSPSSQAEQFASEVIEKLSSPPESPVKLSVVSSPPNLSQCATPPPTPVASVDSLVFTSTKQTTGSGVDVDGQVPVGESSVDPPLCGSEANLAMSQSLSQEKKSSCQASPTKPPVDTKKTSTEVVSTSLKDSTSEMSTPAVAANSDKPAVANKKERDPTKPTFRVTCNRVGDGHVFDSSSAAASFGSSVITYFDWSVDLKNYDIEVILNIDNEEVTMCLGLTRSSLHYNRHLVAFGPTTLRGTICYNMLRLCRIRKGDFVCDPLCGSSAIPIEGAVNWRDCFHFGGDFHPMAMERTAKNIKALQDKCQEENRGTAKIDAVQWNIENFPLRDRCVDVFVSDLPFGHRMGSRTVNRTLYPCVLAQMARTGRPGARACLLTEDRTSLIKAIQTMGKYWQRRLVLSVNVGGLSGFVFLLTRTTAALDPGTWRDLIKPRAPQGTKASPASSSPSPMTAQKVEKSSSSSSATTTQGSTKESGEPSPPSPATDAVCSEKLTAQDNANCVKSSQEDVMPARDTEVLTDTAPVLQVDAKEETASASESSVVHVPADSTKGPLVESESASVGTDDRT